MDGRNLMGRIGKRLMLFLFSVFILSLVIFYISRLAPGDPLLSYYGERVAKMSPKEREWAEEKLGLKDSISVQYFRWLEKAFQGDFGISYKYKMDAAAVVGSRIGNTAVLGGIGGLQSRNFKQLYSGILAVTCVNFNFFGEFEIITKQWRL